MPVLRIRSRFPLVAALVGAVAVGLTGCGPGGDPDALRGSVAIDGSSTVFPVAEALAEEFQLVNPRVQITVSYSGTGGGLRRFCDGETDMATASREIHADELERCRANRIEPLQLSVAADGLSLVVNPSNDWVSCLTLEELRRIWEPGSTVRSWAEVREGFPDVPLRLYGAGTSSGTFDYFTLAVNGREGASRTDYQASEDDNVLVQGVAGDAGALGYFGFAYVVENEGRLRLIAVDGGGGCVLPEPATITDGSYAPLSRELFMYVDSGSLAVEPLRSVVDFLLREAAVLVPPTGYLPLPDEHYRALLEQVAR